MLPTIRELLSSAHRLLRPRRQRVQLECLHAPAEVLFDDAEIPYLFASTQRDLLALQGYVHASLRLFQMELLRRLGRGQLSEVLGRRPLALATSSPYFAGLTTVDLDALMRALELDQAAELSREQAVPEFRDLMAAYADGVNEFLRRHRRRIEPELVLLRISPEPWTERDPFLLYKAFAYQLCLSWSTKLTLHALLARNPQRGDVLRRLILANARVDDTAVRFDAAAAARLAELGKAAVAFVGRPASAPGSNAWAIEGWRSATGHPLLCNDPHLPLLAPSMLLLQHLEAPGVKVAGLGGPGIPGIAMGHNAHCAWGVTHAFVDDCDVFAEQLDGERCATPAGPVELRTRTVHIMVRDAVVEQRVIRYSPHGPLLSDLIARRDDLPPSYALRWSGRDGSRDLEGFWAMARAESWTDFRGAAALLGTPAWNLVYADRQHIGYCLAGAVPRRPWGGSLEIVDGARHGDWQGYVPAAELPHLLDPEDGIVASANDRVVDEGYPHYISDLFEPPFRVRRIRQLLTATPLHDVEQMRRVQLDDFSEWAFRINRERLQPLAADVRDADAQFALRVLSSWDGRLRVDYVAPSVFHAFLLAFARRVLAAALGSDLADLTLSQVEMPALPLEKIMARDPEAWLGEPGGEGEVAALIEAALADAVQQLRALAGPRPGAWTWGALHQVTHRHLLDDGTALRHLSIGPTPSAGDWSTLNLGLYRPSEPFASIVGADARLIVDLADFDRSRWVLSTGQSGNPLSPCYRDQASLMARGLDRAWPFSRGAIEAAASRRIQADPAVRGEAATRS